MLAPEEIQSKILKAIPDAEVTVQDLTGGGDHFQVVVLSPSFRGKTRIEQHQMVHQALEALKDEIHALAIKTIAS
jgi:stress-induced morphogen